MADDDFYIGYAERAPSGLRKHLRPAIALALIGPWLLGALFSALQKPFSPSVFEFGNEREFVGFVRMEPVPTLLVANPNHDRHGAHEVDTSWCRSALTAFPLTRAGTKFGAEENVGVYAGELVRLRAWLIYRDNRALLDVVPGSIAAIDGHEREAPEGAASVESLGTHTLRGEIVDSKCFFGVMNPGEGKVHRACAARCIESGTPPVFAMRDRGGAALYLLLVGPDGRALNREITAAIARPLEITGRVTRLDNLLILWAEPSTFRQL